MTMLAKVSSLQSEVANFKAGSSLLQLQVDELKNNSGSYLDHEKRHCTIDPKDLKVIMKTYIDNINFTQYSTKDSIFTSCRDILQRFPASFSGYYLIRLNNGYYVYTYCDMTMKCGGITGGWSRLAYLNIHEPGAQCPTGLKQKHDPLSCARSEIEGGCSSVMYTIGPMPYTHICGKINGIQYRGLDGFTKYTSIRPKNPTIDDNYVDGISLTYGNAGSRSHIWTFVASPCSLSEQSIPQFVGNHYSFDGGTPGTGPIFEGLLWDEHQCPFSPAGSEPWFYRKLPQNSFDGIEMRLCRDQDSADENLLIQHVEIFVQ